MPGGSNGPVKLPEPAVFWEGMPDLNFRNPEVTKEMDKVTSFWLKEVGVDGFRLDGARHLIEDGKEQVNTPETHDWFKNFRTLYKSLNPKAVTVGEIADTTFNVFSYVQGDQLDLAFDFDLAKALVKSAGSGNNNSVNSLLKLDTGLFQPNQFSPFLTNHDQNRVLSQLGEDVRKAKVAASLLLTAPGVPFIYYGEEIGMSGVKPDEMIRTPMQWTAKDQAGFTTGTPWEEINTDYKTGVNVVEESADPQSLLSHYKALIAARNSSAGLRLGDFSLVDTGDSSVFASLRFTKEDIVLVLINLSGSPVTDYKLSLSSAKLAGIYKALPLLGKELATNGEFPNLTANSGGGFDAYQPVASLPAYSTLIIHLVPGK